MNWTMAPIILGILLSTFVVLAATNESPVKFASSYGSHMVLHRSPRQAKVWGYADMAYIGDKVHFSLINKDNQTIDLQTATVVTLPMRQTGLWSFVLPPMPPGGPYRINVSVVTMESAELSDVYFGDVWLCSGQSNMEVSVDHTMNDTAEMEGASNYPDIRLFTVGRSWSETSEDDVRNIFLKWTRPDSKVVGKFSSLCWSYGRKLHEHTGVPVGLVASSWGGTRIEAWSSLEALEQCGDAPPVKNNHNRESMLWNAMIQPLLQMTITGVIWYQGEFNARVDRTVNPYDCRFPAMIDDWRLKFFAATDGQTDRNFPFGFVQLAAETPDMTKVGGFPSLRWMQTANTGKAPNSRMTNTFMAVAMDLPDFDSRLGPNHPEDKSTISSRLLLGYRAVGLKESGVRFSGPLPSSYRLNTEKTTLQLQYGDSTLGLQIRNDTGFELCCGETTNVACEETSRYWKPARITEYTNDTLTLQADPCHSEQVLAHRYAWRTTPCLYKNCAVYSAENELPAPTYVKYGILKNDYQWHQIMFDD